MPGAAATLSVNEAPLVAAMAFAPATIAQGGISTLRYTLDNSASVAATQVALSDTLPASVLIAAVPNAQTSCAGGSVSAPADGDTIAFTGATLAPGATCTIAVDVTSALAGTYPNETQSVTSSLGTGTPAAATLIVDAAEAPGFARVFAPDTIAQGGETRIVLTIDNSANAIAMTGMAFEDTLPAGVSVAATPGVDNSCAGTFNPVASAGALAFTGGTLAAGQSCTLALDVQALVAGTLENVSGELTSDLPDAVPGAAATLSVNEAPLVAAMAFAPATIAQGGISTLRYTLDNSASVAATQVALSDTLPASVLVAAVPNAQTSCAGGSVSAPADGDTIAFTGATLAPGATCTIAVDVTSALAGTYPNETQSVTSSLGTGTPATATLIVDAAPLPAFMASATKTADRRTSVFGETVNFVMSFTNQSDIMIANGRIVDLLPSGMIYTPGSARVAGTPVEPLVDGRRLEWRRDLAPGEPIEVRIAARVIRTGRFGTLTNRTFLENRFGRTVSNVAEADVRIDPEHIFDCSDVIGRVFHDRNGNGYQDGPDRLGDLAI